MNLFTTKAPRHQVKIRKGRFSSCLGVLVVNRGFTLLEVLVAMCILVLAIATILPLFAVGTASHKRGMDQTMVSMIAPHISARLQEDLTSDRPRDVKDAQVVYQGRTFQYDAAFTPLDASDPTRAAFIVRVTIKWNDASKLRTEQFDTILLRRLRR